MEIKAVTFVPHGLNSPEVRARIAQGDAAIQANMARINARLEPRMSELAKRVNGLIRSKRNAEYCIPEFWRAVDTLYSGIGDDVACKRGCSHCCHVQVLITEDEAAVIGKRIGRKPQKPAKTVRRNDRLAFDWGYHNPCTFLVDGECSIYDNRPLPCRLQYSVDVDSLMCELTPPEFKSVPYLNPHQLLMAFLQMLGVPHREPLLADIRDFFPKVSK